MPTFSKWLDETLAGKSPSVIVFWSVGGAVAVHVLWKALIPGRLLKRINGVKWRIVRFILRPLIAKKVKEAASQIEFRKAANQVTFEALPKKGVDSVKVIKLATTSHSALDQDYKKGGFSGTVYHGGEEHTKLVNRVMEIFQWTNPLHIDIFGAVRKMEAEVAQMVVTMYKGPEYRSDACGAVTSGGTESIGMAMKTYRDWARAERNIENGSVVVPITAHPAFDKAASYYGFDLIKVPVEEDGRVDPEKLEKYIRADTIAIVGSAPCFPYGTIDPIPELAAIAKQRNIGMHVDACLGGFINPFLKDAGFNDVTPADFSVPGVTSISCDTHKYGFAPKGTSVIMYESTKLRSYQFFAIADWPGGMYCSPAMAGSKPGNVIAGTWAAMINLGHEGYVKSCRAVVSTARRLIAGVRSNPHLRVLGDPKMCVFGFTSDVVDIFVLGDRLKERGWFLNSLQFPSGLQFSVTLLQSTDVIINRFLKDVDEITKKLAAENAHVRSSGGKVRVGEQGSTMYGSQQRVGDRTILNDVMKVFLDGYYSTKL